MWNSLDAPCSDAGIYMYMSAGAVGVITQPSADMCGSPGLQNPTLNGSELKDRVM